MRSPAPTSWRPIRPRWRPPGGRASKARPGSGSASWSPGRHHRFAGYGRNRRGFEERNEAFTVGDRLTGLMFGRDALVARLYDKTQEIRRRGISWLPDLWGIDTQSGPVWRLEFQFRRKVLVEFDLRGVEDTLASLQDLWRYGVSDWL